MTDDGQMVTLSEDEYLQLHGRLAIYLSGRGNWEFPWKGPRSILIKTESNATESGNGKPKSTAAA